jgi:hypothetical protein
MQINDTDFLLNIDCHKQFSIGNIVILSMSLINESDVKGLKAYNDYLRRVKKTLDFFGVNEEFSFDNLTDLDKKNLNSIIHAAEGDNVYYNKELPSMFYSNVKIGNLIIRILSKKDEINDSYKLFNAFKDEAHIMLELEDQNGNLRRIKPWSLFLHMKAEDFLCSNLKCDIIIKSIKKMKVHDRQMELSLEGNSSASVNNLLLEVLKVYDTVNQKNHTLLELAIDLSKLLCDKSPITIINKLQVIKRKRSLFPDEIACLVKLRKNEKSNKALLCGIAILLDQHDEAKRMLDEMSEIQKKSIVEYPIYNLFNRK